MAVERERSSPSLRRTWLASSVVTALVLAAFGAVAVAATGYQRSVFSATTAQVDRSSEALVELRLALDKADDPAFAVLGLPADDGTWRQFNVYLQASREVDIRFERVRAVAPEGALPAVDLAEQTWQEADQEVRDAGLQKADGGVLDEEAFAGAWAEFRSVPRLLAEVERAHTRELQERVAAVDRVQRLIPVVLGVGLLLALGTSAVAARQVSRRVVTPLSALRRAALSIGEVEQWEAVDVRGAGAELQDLACAFEDAAGRLRASHRQLREQAFTDALTGLPNRAAFIADLEQRCAAGQAALGVLFVDLDDFKAVNDTLGHGGGDALLRAVAGRLTSAVRGGDVVARLGGDEFAVLVDCRADAGAAAAVAARVLASLREPVELGPHRASVECSIGVATTGGTASSPDEVLRNADFAMYLAKGRGKGCVETFVPSMHLAVQAQLAFKHDLAHAAERGELVLHHQPVVEVATGRVVGAEALVRWVHPERGLVPPGDFVPLAEETGDVVGIGAWVLDQACADLVRHRARAGRSDLWASVNVSPVQLVAPGFADAVAQALHRHGLPADALMVEVTEHVALPAGAVTTLEQVRRTGVRVALDDFGVGWSSLRYLRELPVDVVKIDRSFVADDPERSTPVLRAVVQLAGDLGLAVVAEGVETGEHLERLQALGPVWAQGYLLGRPVPVLGLPHDEVVLPARHDGLPQQRRSGARSS